MEADLFILKEAYSRERQWVFLDNGLDSGLFIHWDRLICVFLRFYLDAGCRYVCCVMLAMYVDEVVSGVVATFVDGEYS